jgi:Flp pilus assembly protein TadG
VGGEQWRGEDGNVLLLFPAAVLVLVILGALAVDFSIVYLGEREAADLAAALANDAASALDESAFYGEADPTAEAEFRLDEDRAAALIAARVDAREREGDGFTVVGQPTLSLDGATRLRVTVTAEVPLVFSRALPGAPRVATVEASAEVDAVRR